MSIVIVRSDLSTEFLGGPDRWLGGEALRNLPPPPPPPPGGGDNLDSRGLGYNRPKVMFDAIEVYYVSQHSSLEIICRSVPHQSWLGLCIDIVTKSQIANRPKAFTLFQGKDSRVEHVCQSVRDHTIFQIYTSPGPLAQIVILIHRKKEMLSSRKAKVLACLIRVQRSRKKQKQKKMPISCWRPLASAASRIGCLPHSVLPNSLQFVFSAICPVHMHTPLSSAVVFFERIE